MIKNKCEIAILLATYNSGKFIKAQINSILNQTNKEWTLYIRDDCSTDDTIKIIKDIQDKDSKFKRIILIDNNNERKGSYLNFVELLKVVDSRYYMFCDHDDIWLSNKIEKTFTKFKETEKNNNCPIIVHTDMIVVDSKLDVMCNSFWKYSHLCPQYNSFRELIVCNSVNGCTMMFNKKAKEISLQNILFAEYHDILVALSVAANKGIITYISDKTVLYRQHSNNIVGANRFSKYYFFNRLLIFPYSLFRYHLLVEKYNNIKKISFISFISCKILMIKRRLFC